MQSSAISHSVERMAPGPVREEFGRILRETRTGMTRSQSLSAMAKRVDMPAVTNFVAVVNQAEEVGGELSQTFIGENAAAMGFNMRFEFKPKKG